MSRAVELAARVALVGIEAYSLIGIACASPQAAGNNILDIPNVPKAAAPPSVGGSPQLVPDQKQPDIADQAPTIALSENRKRGIALERLDFTHLPDILKPNTQQPIVQQKDRRVTVLNLTAHNLAADLVQLDTLAGSCGVGARENVFMRLIQTGPSRGDSKNRPMSINFDFILPGLIVFSINIDDLSYYVEKELPRYDTPVGVIDRAKVTNLVLQDLAVTGFCVARLKITDPNNPVGDAVAAAIKDREQLLAGAIKPAIAFIDTTMNPVGLLPQPPFR